MNQATLLATMIGISAGHADAGESAARQQIARAGTQPSRAGHAENFTGRARVEPLFAAGDGIDASAAYVTFEPGARSAWHTHPAGQRLVVTSGVGLVQEWGQRVQEIHVGDVITCPPGVKHWHGASASQSMTHVAVTGMVDGKSVDWLEQVTDAQYDASAPAAATKPDREQAIPQIAAAMAASDMPQLRVALNAGLDAGLSIAESKELLVQLYAYAGFPRSLNALGELLDVVEARKQRGIADAPGEEPRGEIPTGDALVALGTANQTRISGAPVTGPVFAFAPAINRFLQAHLFGDIFARDNLDWRSRELATVGALAATPGAEAQLRSHVAASVRVGVSTAQLRRVANALDAAGDTDAARRTCLALDEYLESEKAGERK